MWSKYLEKGKSYTNNVHVKIKEYWDKNFDPDNFKILHTSGHADAETIKAVINAVDPKEAIIPIHCEEKDGFNEFSDKCVFLSNGQTYPTYI